MEKIIRLTPAEQEVMRIRCEEESHTWENGLTATFSFVEICKWCGERR